MEIYKNNRARHYRVGMTAILCLIMALSIHWFCSDVIAQKSGSEGSLLEPPVYGDGDSTESELSTLFGSKDDSAAKSQIHPFVKDRKNCNKCHDVRKMEDSGASYLTHGIKIFPGGTRNQAGIE